MKESKMNVEQIARNFIMNMTDLEKTKKSITTDAIADGGILPQAIPAQEALTIISGLTTAIPDLKFDIQQVTVNGNQATVKALWGGKKTGPLSLPIPGMMTIPPTGKQIWVKDGYVLTVQGDKISHMHVESPADGGIPAALEQLGVKEPVM
jgi:predicted ester cyclase